MKESLAMNAALEISRQVRVEGGMAEESLCAKCKWEHMSRTEVIINYGDPRIWTHKSINQTGPVGDVKP
jgi:hypothetical protein